MENTIYERLTGKNARKLFGFEIHSSGSHRSTPFTIDAWVQHVNESVVKYSDPAELLEIGVATLNAFLQTNVTGPPLTWDPIKLLVPSALLEEAHMTPEGLRRDLVSRLSIDGEAIYHLTPYVELFYVAKNILNPRLVERLPIARLASETIIRDFSYPSTSHI